MRLLLAAVLTLGLLLGTGGSAWAGDKENARTMAKDGMALFHEDRPTAAYERFEKAEALYPSVLHRVYMARCLAAMGRLVEARERYDAILAEDRPERMPKATKAAYAAVEEELPALLARLPRLRITVTGEDVPHDVLLDGEKLATIDEPVEADAGEHRVQLEAEGRPTVGETVVLEEGELTEVTLAIPAPPPPPDDGTLVPAFIAYGVGGAALLAGAITGGLSLAKTSDIEAQCIDLRCPSSLEGDADSAKTLGTVSTVSFIVGGAAVAAGVVLTFVRPGAEEGSGDATVTTVIGPGFVGLRGRF